MEARELSAWSKGRHDENPESRSYTIRIWMWPLQNASNSQVKYPTHSQTLRPEHHCMAQNQEIFLPHWVAQGKLPPHRFSLNSQEDRGQWRLEAGLWRMQNPFSLLDIWSHLLENWSALRSACLRVDFLSTLPRDRLQTTRKPKHEYVDMFSWALMDTRKLEFHLRGRLGNNYEGRD